MKIKKTKLAPQAFLRHIVRTGLILALTGVWHAQLEHACGQEKPTRTNVFVMNVDGSETKPFVSVDQMPRHGSPAWSPDGERMAFDAAPDAEGGAKAHIFTATLKEPKKSLADLGPGHVPSWSPDGQQIAFYQHSKNPEGAKAGVWLMHADGGDRKWLSEGQRPRWSADGSQLAFASNHDGFWSLYVIENGVRRRVLFEKYDRVVGASWSPDGKLLAYIAYRNTPDEAVKDTELGVCSASGRDEAPRIRYRGEIGWQPAWSPDGRRIAFWLLDARGAHRLVLLQYAGDEEPLEIRGQSGAGFNSDPAWSPDGKRLAFTSDR